MPIDKRGIKLSELVESNVGSQYSDETRREVAALYVCHGNIPHIARLSNVPQRTIYEWQKTSTWWEPLVAEIRNLTKDSHIAKLEAVVERAFDQVLDRVDNGDHVVVQGEIMRVPMKGKDLAVTGAVALDKSRLLQGAATSIRADSSTTADLVKRFEELAAQSQERVVSDQ